ncbi:MAG: hypothetical protein JKY65_08520 [Planctomycetes bacterium]|nr:hypothetical protein [Planctomycetota bacterium]
MRPLRSSGSAALGTQTAGSLMVGVRERAPEGDDPASWGAPHCSTGGKDRSRWAAPRFDQRVWVVGHRLNSASLWGEFEGGSRRHVQTSLLQIGENPNAPWSSKAQ